MEFSFKSLLLTSFDQGVEKLLLAISANQFYYKTVNQAKLEFNLLAPARPCSVLPSIEMPHFL